MNRVETPTTGCRAQVTQTRLGPREPREPTEEPNYHLRYRATCPTCGHTGPARSDENAAAEDACDHAYPGWRTLPVLEHRPLDYQTAAVAHWEEAARRAYPPGWFDQQGPVRTERSPGGTRHVPGRAPGGGYDMTGRIRRPTPTTPKVEAPALFDAPDGPP